MDFDKNTPRKEITVQKTPFSVIAPYAEGHALTETEANVLNQTLAENIRNNFAATVKKAVEEAGGDPSAINVKDLQKQLDAYTAEYKFGVRRAGGGGSRVMDPVEKKSMEIARSKVREFIKSKSIKVSTVPAAKITELAKELIEKTPAITEEAKRQIEASQAVAADALGGELDGLLADAGKSESK